MQLTLQNVLIVVLPLLGLILPGVLKQDHYSPQMNSVIAFIIVVLASAGTAYSKDQFGPNFFLDMGIVVTGISALLGGPLKGMDAYLQSNVFSTIESQLAAVLPVSTPVVATTSIPANALIHIASVSTLHVNAPTSTPDPVATVQESVNASSVVPGDIVPDVAPPVVGITTQESTNEKTQKIAVVKPTVQLG